MITSVARRGSFLLILPLLLSAHPVAVAGSTTTNYRLRGDSVSAEFESLLPESPLAPGRLIVAKVFVHAADLLEKVNANGSSTRQDIEVNVFLIDVSPDNPFPILLFDGTQESGTRTLRVSSDVRSATLTGTIMVRDRIFHDLLPVQLNLSWTATSKPEFGKTQENVNDKEAGIKIKAKSRSTLAEAVATGTVIMDVIDDFVVILDDQNLTLHPSESASIMKQNDGTLIIEKQIK